MQKVCFTNQKSKKMEISKIKEILEKVKVSYNEERRNEIEIVSDFCEKKNLKMIVWKSSGEDRIGFELYNPRICSSEIELYPHWSKAKGDHFLFGFSGEGEIPNTIENLHSSFRNYQ